MTRTSWIIAWATAVLCIGVSMTSAAPRADRPMLLAAGPANDKGSHDPGAARVPDNEHTPEQKMQRRFPQPVRIGDLLGLAVLDEDDSTIGYVRDVVRTPQGKVLLIVPYSSWFGWASVSWGKRPVAVPIEVVAILARQLNALDMSRDDFDDAPTWDPAQGKPIGRDEKTLIALGRR